MYKWSGYSGELNGIHYNLEMAFMALFSTLWASSKALQKAKDEGQAINPLEKHPMPDGALAANTEAETVRITNHS